ncbi:hypothetical protein BG015_007100 [Linnemannia schmuckeri]|uniref:F-box domain-containing protein n=1 Tax=Linnemannia schmuckeri TaxID=64567 RepID=A0A9P5RYZ3_9FUNG|nr:hypothetical protein BG015_007100 [Linnemannia schmuckeri]
MSSLPNSNTQISTFDIPHILHLICDELSKDQLLICLEVSRTWRANFTPQALRHVRFSNLKGHQTWTILHSASLIRSLTIDVSDAGWFLDNAFGSSYYANLRELHYVDFNYRHKSKPVGYYCMRPSIVDQYNNPLRLVEACPKLETLIVDNLSRQYRTDHFTEAIFKSIYTHTSLATIKIHLECAPLEFSTVVIKSLPTGLKDFELSVMKCIPFTRQFSWSPAPRQFYPKDGYPWQQQEDSMESSLFSGSRSLPLERLALGELHPRARPGWAVMPAEDAEPAVIIDRVILNPGPGTSCCSYNWSLVGIEMVQSCAERPSGLRHLVLNGYYGSWINLLQLLLNSCPCLETIDLSSSGAIDNYPHNNSTFNGIVQLRGTFVVLKGFRMSGTLSEQSYTAVARIVIRSAATLEALDRLYTLRELGIYRHGGSLMTDYRWHINSPFSIWGPIEDYSTVFEQLEKLRLAVEEPYLDLDERDDEEWKPLKDFIRTEEERSQERAGTFQSLKDLKQLRELEIEWFVCPSISNLALENALELFRDAEFKNSSNNGNNGEYEGPSKRWWEEVTQGVLVWLCLPWLSQSDIKSSKVPSHLIEAAARQYQNKVPLPAGCHDIADYSNKKFPWSTGDIYNVRVGRQWKD